MNVTWQKHEQDVLRELIYVGLQGAARSFSALTQGNMEIRPELVRVSSETGRSLAKGSDVHVLLTEIKGELRGHCALLLSAGEARRMVAAGLPPGALSDPTQRAAMTEAFLLEVDNIVTAAVVTQFSNVLGVRMYGDVPRLCRLPQSDIPALLDGLGAEVPLLFQTHFVTDADDLRPELIWMMESGFADRIRALANDAEKTRKFRAYAAG